jgi:hypothetical protein
MTFQFIHDNQGNTTGVFIPIEEWQTLKAKYNELESEEINNTIELQSWQKEIIDQRLNQYQTNPSNLFDLNKTLDELEKGL